MKCRIHFFDSSITASNSIFSCHRIDTLVRLLSISDRVHRYVRLPFPSVLAFGRHARQGAGRGLEGASSGFRLQYKEDAFTDPKLLAERRDIAIAKHLGQRLVAQKCCLLETKVNNDISK